MSELDGVAATVVLLRDSRHGPEVLLLERPRRGSFAGAWVFPGGALEPVDVEGTDLTPDDPADEDAAARRAAARETFEETALAVSPQSLVRVSRWHPPREAPKRFRTWFYAAAAPATELVLAPGEVVASRWVSPRTALDLHSRIELSLYPPTWVTLHDLQNDGSTDAALARLATETPRDYTGRFGPHQRILFWSEDVAHGDDALQHAEGARHRLDMTSRPWVYERSVD